MQTKEKGFHAAVRAEKQVNFVGLHDSNVRSKSNIAILAVSARADNTRMRQVGCFAQASSSYGLDFGI